MFVCLFSWRYNPFGCIFHSLVADLASSCSRFLDHTQRRATVVRTHMDEEISPSQRPLPDNTQHSQQTNIHAPGGIRIYNLSGRAAEDLRFRPHFHL